VFAGSWLPGETSHRSLSAPAARTAISACYRICKAWGTGEAWLHEIKHDGFRVVVVARKDGERVRLYSPPGNELTDRFPLIVEALVRSTIVDRPPPFLGYRALSKP
jgi:hypothetical protein